MEYYIVPILIILAVNAALAFLPAKLAKDKGYSFAGFWCLSFFLSYFTGLIAADGLRDKTQNEVSGLKTSYKDFLGFTFAAAVLAFAIVIGSSDNRFFTGGNLGNLMEIFNFYAAAALAAVLTMRAKGPDISIGSLSVLAGFIIASDSTYIGIITAAVVCLAIGIVNGILAVNTRIPAVIITLFTAVLAWFAVKLIFGTIPVMGGAPQLHKEQFYILLAIAAAISFPLIFFTNLGLSKGKRPESGMKVLYIAAYAGSALIACALGYFSAARNGAADSGMGDTYYYITALVFFSASGRLLDNRAGALFALVPAFVWLVLDNAMGIYGMNSFYQTLVQAVLLLVFSLVFFVSRSKMKLMSAPLISRITK